MSLADGHACHASVADLPADARALIDAAGQRDFQASPAWFDNFVRSVDLGDARPEFHTWRAGGRLLALLPLLASPGRVQALGNYYTTRWAPLLAADLAHPADPADPAVAAEAARAVQGLQHLLQALLRTRSVHTLQFGPQPAGSPGEQALQRALQAAGCAVWPLHAFQNWTLPVNTQAASAWPDYLAARDGKLRTTIKRMGKRFAAKGGRLELLHGGPRLEAGIAAYEAVYAASWKEPEPHKAFMPGLIRAAAAQGQLRLALAWLGEQPVAAQVWTVAGGRADIYKLAHDERHKETSPGTLLTTLLMQHVFEVDRVQVVDYLSGDDDYKRLWMSQVREYHHLLAYNLRHPRGALLAARQACGVAARRGLDALRGRPAASPVVAPDEEGRS